jgi:hypothetical protein
LTEDLGIKVGSKEEKVLSDWLETKEQALIASQIDVQLNEYAIELLKERIATEKDKFK